MRGEVADPLEVGNGAKLGTAGVVARPTWCTCERGNWPLLRQPSAFPWTLGRVTLRQSGETREVDPDLAEGPDRDLGLRSPWSRSPAGRLRDSIFGRVGLQLCTPGAWAFALGSVVRLGPWKVALMNGHGASEKEPNLPDRP